MPDQNNPKKPALGGVLIVLLLVTLVAASFAFLGRDEPRTTVPSAPPRVAEQPPGPVAIEIHVPSADAPKSEWTEVEIPPRYFLYIEESPAAFKAECEDIDSGKRQATCARGRKAWFASSGAARTLHYWLEEIKR